MSDHDVETALDALEDASGSAPPAGITADGEMVVGGFRFSPTRLIPIGQPDFEDWDRVGVFLRYIHTGAQFWIGDWLNYGETAYGEKYTQAVEHTGYDLHTLQTYAWIARSVAPDNRKEDVPFGHYANGIAALEPDEQRHWIARITDEGLTQSELKTALRLAKRNRVNANVPLPEGQHRVIYTDNPWQYDDSGEIKGTAYGKAERHYPTMSIDELCAFYANLKERGNFAPDAVMFMWVPAPLLLQKPGPREVIEAAGFEPKTGMVWDKVRNVYGHYVSVRHEHLIICTRGSCTPDEPTPMPDSVVTADGRGLKHSEKPPIFRKVIQKLYTSGPYLELFGRAPVKGWTVYGNDPAVAMEPK